MGRLFDAVASLLGVCQEVSYEGQAAVELEHLARTASCRPTLDFAWDGVVLDPAPVILALAAGMRTGADPAGLAAAFHDAVVRATVRAAADTAVAAGITTVGLTGGVFVNRLLLTGIAGGLRACGLEVLTHGTDPDRADTDGDGLSDGDEGRGVAVDRPARGRGSWTGGYAAGRRRVSRRPESERLRFRRASRKGP